jgi:hypothetical protein
MGFELTIIKSKNALDVNGEKTLREILLYIQDNLLRYFDICSSSGFAHRVLYYKFKNAQLIAESYGRTYIFNLAKSDNKFSTDIKKIINSV